jgi:hypothetical protein
MEPNPAAREAVRRTSGICFFAVPESRIHRDPAALAANRRSRISQPPLLAPIPFQ